MNILQSIGAGIASIGIFIGSLFGYAPAQAPDIEELGRAVNPVATNNYVIAGSGISSSATTITLSSFTAPVSGVKYSMANFGDGVNAKGYLTIEPGSRTRQEIVSFTGITQNADGSATLTGVTRGLLPFSPFTASSTYATAHNGGAQVTVSNPPQLYDAIYSYIDNATTSGAIDGTTLAKGIYETATGLEAASTTAVGGGNTTATLVLTTLVATSTSPTSGNYVPVTRSDGNLSDTFLPNTTKQVNTAFEMLASSTFTGATSPQAAYTATSSNRIVLANAVSATSSAFRGFVITNTSANASATVQVSGIVSGFTGLSAGSYYYLQDTAGTIGTTPGTNEVRVGIAISTTELLIQKNRQVLTGTATLSATGVTTITTGFKPSKVRIHASSASTLAAEKTRYSNGGWSQGGGNDCVYVGEGSSAEVQGGVVANAWYIYDSSPSTGHAGNVTNITNTSFDLSNTKSGSADNALIFWEAEGE